MPLNSRTKEEVQAYVEKFNLQNFLQDALQKVIDEMPDDPYTMFAEIFTKQAAAAPSRHDMSKVFMNFDVDGDGKLTISEFARAFRALGLKKRDGEKLLMDKEMFDSFDINGDGFCSLVEIEAGLKPKTRKKIEAKLDAGWTFDKEAWEKSVARHARWDMAKVFKQFDADGDFKLDIWELARAFRALGLPKREGEKFDLDKAEFKKLDSSGDGYVDLIELEANMNPQVRKLIEEKLDAGWTFDKAAWEASCARHAKYNMKEIFNQFDVDGDGKLTIHEFGRAFRALGLKKRNGKKMLMDKEMFDSFDTNGDGFCDLNEIDAGLKPKTRKKIEEKLAAGWTFDKEAWEASCARHARWDMAKIFKQFDADGDGKLDIWEIARGIRALGLPKREGEKADMDKAMFEKMDTNGDGFCSTEELEANMDPQLRKLIEEKLDAGWKFDKAAWEASVVRHQKYNMEELFAQFDSDGDQRLDIHELARAFRALGLPKRDGSKLEVDKAMFASFDVNGDGFVSLHELAMGLKPKTRAKIEEKLEGGWTFDAEAWKKSCERHARWDMAKVFKQFDADGDGKLDIREFRRAFRALGLKKRDGEKFEVDKAMFDSFDTNKDGVVTLQEFEENLHPKTRKKIEELLDGGWTFDAEAWDASIERHKNDGAAE